MAEEGVIVQITDCNPKVFFKCNIYVKTRDRKKNAFPQNDPNRTLG